MLKFILNSRRPCSMGLVKIDVLLTGFFAATLCARQS
jgi:hypothetical protein